MQYRKIISKRTHFFDLAHLPYMFTGNTSEHVRFVSLDGDFAKECQQISQS